MPLTLLLAVVVSAAAFAGSTHPPRPALVRVIPKASAAGTNFFDFLVVIVMENHNLCDILKSCGGTATYMSNLAGAWGLAQDDRYCNVNPSLPNYLCLTGGSDFASSGYDADPQSNACTTAAWLTPNTCNDIHSCPIDTGDAYLADLVQRILSSPVFTTQRAALYITFDEGKGNNGQPVYTVWAGRVVKPTYTSSVAYNHFSLLATIESNWNLPNLTANDAGAAAMTEFFTSNPPASDTVAPTIAIDSPSNHSSAWSPVSVTGTAFDNIAIQKVEVRVDGGAWTTAPGTTSR